ncbi:MAG: sigma-54-dependent Fis family transcriptional regulator [Gammaproteobacteria bacterium]|nr:sigma-54-dependent Fis family transcriptional regulator [Gammaproteobacteria bacterium]
MSQSTVLVVEDDFSLREALCDTLSIHGFNVAATADGSEALSYLEDQTSDAKNIGMIVSDVQMKPVDGYQLLNEVKIKYPEIPFVLMTAYGSIPKAVEAVKHGAADYLVKPFVAEKLVELVQRLLPDRQFHATDLIAEDPRSLELLELAKRVAPKDATVLLCGESGTGKEVFAQFIHQQSLRKDKAFIAINCAAIPENMLESVLFGYEKGAFTGAYKSMPGKFEQAQGGTLLLDEISEMDLNLQAKLLRVLQEREVERLGSTKTISLDVRIIATTNKNLQKEVKNKNFREDLFYRLNVFPIQLLPIRERVGDITPIAQSLIAAQSGPNQMHLILSDDAIQKLQTHTWPGNVRELGNTLQRAAIICHGDTVTADDIIFESCFSDDGLLSLGSSLGNSLENNEQDHSLGSHLKNHEFQAILDTLVKTRGSRKNTAEQLGISQRTLRYKMAKMRDEGIFIPD